jgi:hypothetical protein
MEGLYMLSTMAPAHGGTFHYKPFHGALRELQHHDHRHAHPYAIHTVFGPTRIFLMLVDHQLWDVV